MHRHQRWRSATKENRRHIDFAHLVGPVFYLVTDVGGVFAPVWRAACLRKERAIIALGHAKRNMNINVMWYLLHIAPILPPEFIRASDK